MRVSIIIPFYNSEDYLEKCIESVTRQTYSDIEIILVNDGSQDASEQICRDHAERDPRIMLLSQPNHGVSCARNTGLEAAKGDLITFIDSDDTVEEDYIEYLIRLLEKDGSDIACCRHEDTLQGVREDRTVSGPEEILKVFLTSNDIFAVMWGKIYKRELFDGIRFPEGKRFEDNFVLYRLLDRCRLVSIGNQKKYNYISNPDSFIHSSFNERDLDIVDAMLAQRDFIEQSYPLLTHYANSLVIYAVNRCLVKMADSGICDNECIEKLKPLYKKYGRDFLKGTSHRSAKNFYKVARFSPKLSMHIYRICTCMCRHRKKA